MLTGKQYAGLTNLFFWMFVAVLLAMFKICCGLPLTWGLIAALPGFALFNFVMVIIFTR